MQITILCFNLRRVYHVASARRLHLFTVLILFFYLAILTVNLKGSEMLVLQIHMQHFLWSLNQRCIFIRWLGCWKSSSAITVILLDKINHGKYMQVVQIDAARYTSTKRSMPCIINLTLPDNKTTLWVRP